MNDVLRKIVEATRERLAAEREPAEDLARLAEQSVGTRKPHRFRDALLGAGRHPRVIAEIKAASPSAGTIVPKVDPDGIAMSYRRGGAAAISVVTEPQFFKGDVDWVRKASQATRLPVLMKDFVVEQRQIDLGIARGADGILLLASLLDVETMRQFLARIESLGRDALVEVHDEAELEIAIAAGAGIIGVNNRDLRSFHVDLATAERLAPKIPAGALKVAESGIRSAGDALRMRAAGFDAVLVGEHLLRQDDRAAGVRELAGGPVVKVCGITRAEDGIVAAEEGAGFLGFVFAESSPRKVSAGQAKEIIDAVRGGGHRPTAVGVFRDQPIREVLATASEAGMDMIQFHGSELAAMLMVCDRPVIRAFGVGESLPSSAGWGGAAWLLYDRATPNGGGSGETFDWSLLETIDRRQRFFLAGGLTPENVREAVKKVQPDGIDVSSGVEESPGRKSAEKIRRFFEEVRNA